MQSNKMLLSQISIVGQNEKLEEFSLKQGVTERCGFLVIGLLDM